MSCRCEISSSGQVHLGLAGGGGEEMDTTRIGILGEGGGYNGQRMSTALTSGGGEGDGGGGEGEGGSGDGDREGQEVNERGPQSRQSVPQSHIEYSLPVPPSSQTPLYALPHALVHMASTDAKVHMTACVSLWAGEIVTWAYSARRNTHAVPPNA